MASLIYKHNSYYAVFSIKRKKKWIRIGSIDRKEAKKILRRLEVEHIKGNLGIKDNKPILLYDFLDQYMVFCKTNKAWNTHRIEQGISRDLRAFYGNVMLNSLDSTDIESYKHNEVCRGLAPSGINRKLAAIKFMFRKAKEWGYIEKVPYIPLLKLPRRPVRYLSIDEMERLLECSSEWLRPILLVLRNTGMRMGEVLDLQFSNIDLERSSLVVYSPKTRNHRVIPINLELKNTLEWLAKYYVNPSNLMVSQRESHQREYVFCHKDGSRISSFRTSFRTACRKAGVRATVHTIRHTFASHLVMNGVDLVSIKELLGHSTISTTMIYSHVSSEYKSQTVTRLPWIYSSINH